MPKQLQPNGSVSITAMSLVEFLPLVVEALKEGYELDLQSNEGVPQQLGTLLVLTMFKKVTKPIKTGNDPVSYVTEEVVTEVAGTQPVQRGRPKSK